MGELMEREEAHDGGQAKRQRMGVARWSDNPLAALNLGGSQVKLEAAKGGNVNMSDSFSGSGKEKTWLPAGPEQPVRPPAQANAGAAATGAAAPRAAVAPAVMDRDMNWEDAGWEAQLAKLEAYKQKYGDCNVPARWAEDPKLGSWVHCQRKLKKALDRGEPSKGMAAARAAKLDALGFVWELSAATNSKQRSEGRRDDAPPAMDVPAVGQRLRIWWTVEQQWYSGACVRVDPPGADDDPSDPIVHIHYDDGVGLQYSARHLASGEGWEPLVGHPPYSPKRCSHFDVPCIFC